MRYEELTEAQQLAIKYWHQCEEVEGHEYDYVDNCRYAVKGNAEQEAIYEAAVKDGCCGFCDVELTCTDGSVLLYGFNYGH